MLVQHNGTDVKPAVVVQADDPIIRDGTAAFLAMSGLVTVLPENRLAEAKVAIVVSSIVTGKVLSTMSQVARATSGAARIVLVADSITESQLTLAVGHGLASFLVRSQTDLGQIATTAVESQRGQSTLPSHLVCTLLHRVRAVQAGDSSRPTLPGNLTARDIEVLRLLAEGKEITEIAAKLSYSERLIKSIIHTVIKRQGLRNRTHAVAHAIRAGIL